MIRPHRGSNRRVCRAACLLGALIVPCLARGQSEVVEYYHLDATGNVRAVTNQAGQVIERHDYLPFGEECTTGPCASNSSLPSGQPRKFTGKERDPETGLDYFGARYYGSRIGRFTTTDPVLDQKAALANPQLWNRYAYGRNNPLRFVDPDGRDAIPVAFPNYRIATPIGRLPFLGHAGIILVDSHSGATRYYEYGRYDTEGLGLVRRRTVPDVQMGKDGMPTEASMKKLLDSVSRQSGQSGPVEGAYIRSDSYNEMVGYAEGWRQQNQDPNREPYGLTCNNCATFAKDTLEAGGVDTPSMIDPRPNSYIKELQNASGSRIRHDPSQNKENK